MIVTTEAIVLSAIKYRDTSLIVKCLTASDGIKTYILKGVLAAKKGKLKAAYFQPLTQLELVANHRNNSDLHYISEVRISYPYTTLHANPGKNAILLFLSEVLSHALQEEEENKNLFQYIKEALKWLDTHNEISNFHILFLIDLTRYLGFYPNTKNKMFPFFDLMEGEFVASPSGNPTLANEDIRLLKAFLGTNFDAVHTIKIKKEARQQLLSVIMNYFQLHLHGFKKPKSLSVLNEVFN